MGSENEDHMSGYRRVHSQPYVMHPVAISTFMTVGIIVLSGVLYTTHCLIQSYCMECIVSGQRQFTELDRNGPCRSCWRSTFEDEKGVLV